MQVGIVGLQIIGWFGRDDLFFLSGEMNLQLIGDRFGDFAFDREDVG